MKLMYLIEYIFSSWVGGVNACASISEFLKRIASQNGLKMFFKFFCS